MRLCDEVQKVLLVWDEAADLPEPIAVHVGGCPDCRARFDHIFPRIAMPPEPVRVAQRSWLAPVALVAGVALMLALWGASPRTEASVDLVELIPPECPAEAIVIECPVG